MKETDKQFLVIDIFYECLVQFVKVDTKLQCKKGESCISEENIIPVNRALNDTVMQRLQPTTITICGCKMNVDHDTGETWLTDAPSTRFYINHQNAEESNLRFSFRINNPPTRWSRDIRNEGQ